MIFSSKGCNVHGPRIIVRSIKAIKKGEEVWVAYIDLLQPKVIFIFSIYSSTVKRLNVQNVLVNLAYLLLLLSF